MKYYRLKQGGTDRKDGRWYQPKTLNEPGAFEFNTKHGLMEEITEEQAKYAQWGSGNYRVNEDGTFTCICSDWDSSD